MRSRFASGLGSAIVLLGIVAACGGSEGGPGGEKKAYIDQVDPLCEEAIQEADAAGDATDTPTLQKVKDTYFQLWQSVKAIPVPSEDQDAGDNFVAGLNNISLSAEAAYQASLVGNNAEVQASINEMEQSLNRTSEAAADYGFTECDHLSSAGEPGEQDEEDHEDEH